MSKLNLLLVLLLTMFIGLAACSDDDPGPSDPAGDSTAPLVFSTEPEPDDSSVSPGEDVVVVFNEAMDPASAAGNVTLSAGTISDLVWDDDRTLRIEHSAWPAAARVDVTLGTGIEDLAGNGLELPYEFGFWVATPDVVLLETDPANGATNVARNARVALRFNREMNLTTLTAATSVDDGLAPRALVGFSYSEGSDDQVLLTFDDELAALATITVTIGTGATDTGGQNLASETVFSFTTGSDSDTTPPTLVSVVPADGSSISPSTTAIVFTFSEAIDEARFEPDMLGGQFFFLIEEAGVQVSVSPDGTVLTVPLPAPLPAGLPIYVLFNEFYDLAGNASTTPLEYRVAVSGDADVWPWVDGQESLWRISETRVQGSDPPESQDYFSVKRIEAQGGGSIKYDQYFEIPPTVAEGWEYYARTASSINFLGFGELDEGAPVEASFADPVRWLALPPTPGTTWNGSTTFPFDTVTADLDYSGEVLAVEDLPLVLEGFDLPTIAWINCWKVEVNYELSDDGTTFLTGQQVFWYAPGVGPVRTMSHEEDMGEDRVSDDDEWLLPIDPQDL